MAKKKTKKQETDIVGILSIVILGFGGWVGKNQMDVYIEDLARLPVAGENTIRQVTSANLELNAMPLFSSVMRESDIVADRINDAIMTITDNEQQILSLEDDLGEVTPDPVLKTNVYNPNYAKLVPLQFTLEAVISGRRAIINGHSMEVGDTHPQVFTTDIDRQSLTLVDIGGDGVIVEVGGKRVRLH